MLKLAWYPTLLHRRIPGYEVGWKAFRLMTILSQRLALIFWSYISRNQIRYGVRSLS